ncbi:hypothetical protein B0J11DRAFT_587439 [Dendryphion nanum]|uniref:SEC7 domain-containing protein n=1 Tax=Dendryphion nanum TaxID=256645 RepID=A0A9P9EIV2_9PLEO|nr:hypothetical protein B0J11DRAFT_587439 [Dendryphion nanum]
MDDYNTSRGDDSRPTTPTGPPKSRKGSIGMRTLNTRVKQQESFYEDVTPVDNHSRTDEDDHDRVRDSHDLSLHDGTRDSVVDNMLLSLDQLPSGSTFANNPAALYSNFDGDDFFLTDNPYPPPRATRHRGHTHASSQSSDLEHIDDTSSRYSSHHSRGRRSNSSNNIQLAMSRKSSLRGYTGVREKASNGLFGDFQQTGHSRGGAGKKGSKGSNSSSMDFGHSGFLSGHRLGFGHRSASFDHGNMADRSRAPSTKTDSILDRGRAAYQTYGDYDAAPQPNVPAGPRRVQQEAPQSPVSSYPTQPTYAPPQAPVPRRRGSVRSTATAKTLRKNKSQPEPNMRLQAQEFVNASTLRDLPPIPAFQDPPAPSPTVATRKQMFQAPSTPVAPPKERPGFFRRMFGGGSRTQQPPLSTASYNSNTSYPETSPASSYNRPADVNSMYSQARPQTTPSGSNHIASQIKPAPPQSAHSQHKESQAAPPTLAKKHSSFFRRRKKSVSESSKPPIMAMDFRPPPPKTEALPAQPSPGISSLRKVMNPYLNDLAKPGKKYSDRREQFTHDDDSTQDEQPNGFSPGYKPHKDATVRTVKPGSRGTEETPPSSRGEQVKTMQAISSSPKLKLKMKQHGKANVGTAHDDSFLADSSSCNEDRSGRATPSGEKSMGGMDETRRPSTSPTSTSFGNTPLDLGKSDHHHDTNNINNNNKANPHLGLGEKRSNDLLLRLPTASSTTTTATTTTTNSANNNNFVSKLVDGYDRDNENDVVVDEDEDDDDDDDDDGWVISTSKSLSKEQRVSPARDRSARSKRVWLEPTSSEENLKEAAGRMSLPLEGARTSQKSSEKASPTSPQAPTPTSASDVFHSATSLPVVQIEGRDSDNMPSIVEHRAALEEHPTDADRQRAFDIFTGDQSSVQKAQAATILGDVTLTSMRTRRAFMDLFDWAGFNILAAMRDLCSKLILKAETQQVDRILMSLSERWCECNPNHGFKALDVVHTICYSILLLNTDLHMADIESRMTRSQFVKNTLPTVVRVCKESLKDEETLRPQSTQFRRGSIPWTEKSEPTSPTAEQTSFPADVVDEPTETRRTRSRLSVKPPIRSGSDGFLSTDSATAECNTLVNNPYNGPMKGWELQTEIVLKEFYNSIRQQRLPLHGAPAQQVHEQPSSNNLSVSGMLRRTPSMLSKAPSENTSYRGRSQTDFRSMGNRWHGKTRSRPRLYPNSTVASSRTSLDDGSVWSPAGSSTWSKYSYGKTQTSMSMESLGSHFAHGDYQQAIGFANALSQAIIREEGNTIASNEEFTRVAPLLEDETLELAGAPWAKEGILKHKHHLESLDKKAKDRTWNECFAVIEKGYMRLFSFNMNSKSMRHKNRSRPSAGSVVGGGNWMDNAEALDSFLLRQSIASALPPPGYSKSRPHVWALSLPTGAVHLFQVGTPDIVREFVSTANYWSARLSKEPLMGGVSNIEYGWGDNVINMALIRQEGTSTTQGHVHRPSVASSLRSSMDHATGTTKPRLPGDKVNLSDWSPPTQSMMASNLMEVDQLRALTSYVKNVEIELGHHNDLRAPMLIAFSPRHPNAGKAMANWERKSSYLLREIVKFRTYIDSLTAAQILKDKIYAKREADALQEEEAAKLTLQPASEQDGGIKAPEASETQTITA